MLNGYTKLIKVHPHVCGEHICVNLKSSACDRFIPTCVGNIQGDFSESCDRPVHPHVCGEHVKTSGTLMAVLGSSPRVWGTCFPPGVEIRGVAVHPHVCGEHGSSSRLSPMPNGSSPRVWGTSLHFQRLGLFDRFIPTCVGNMRQG